MNKAIEKIIKERQTVKAYNDKPIPAEDWQQVLDVIQWSPSSFGSEPYRVLVIEKTPHTAPLRKELQDAMWGQGVAVEADKLIFFISYTADKILSKDWILNRSARKPMAFKGLDEKAAREAAKGEEAKILSHFKLYEKDVTYWARLQTYIALGNALSAAAILNIGSTPMEGFDRDKVEAIFKKHKLINKDEFISVAAAFGYPKSDTAYAHWGSGKRVRVPFAEKFTIVK